MFAVVLPPPSPCLPPVQCRTGAECDQPVVCPYQNQVCNPGSNACQCQNCWLGDECNTPVDCGAHGTCGPAGTCVCDNCWSGPTCAVQNTCSGNGLCNPANNQCICANVRT